MEEPKPTARGCDMASRVLNQLAICCVLASGIGAAQDVYVAGFAAKKLYRLTPDRLVKSIPLPGNPLDLVFSGDGQYLYVSEPNRDGVSVLRTSDDSVVALIPTPSSPAKMAVGNADTRLYVANDSVAPPHVTIVDIAKCSQGRKNSVLGSIDISAHGAGSAFAVATFGALLAVGTRTGHVLLYDTAVFPPAFISVRAIGSRVRHVIFSPFGTKLYVLLGGSALENDDSGGVTPPGNLHVLRVPTLELKKVVSAGRSGLRWAALVGASHLYVTDVRGWLHTIDVGSDAVTGSAAVGRQLSGIAATDNRLFVADIEEDLLRTIAPAARDRQAQVVGSVSLERHAAPTGVAVLPANRAASSDRVR